MRLGAAIEVHAGGGIVHPIDCDMATGEQAIEIVGPFAAEHFYANLRVDRQRGVAGTSALGRPTTGKAKSSQLRFETSNVSMSAITKRPTPARTSAMNAAPQCRRRRG